MMPHNNRTPATGNSQSSGAPLPLRTRSSVPSGTTRRMSSGPSRNTTSSNLNGSRQSVEREMENIFGGSDLHDHPPLVPENTPTAPIMGMGLTSEDVSIVDKVRQQEPRHFRQIPMEPLLELTRQQGLAIDDRRVFEGVFLNPSRASGPSGSASQPLTQYSNATSSLLVQRASRSRPRPSNSSNSSVAANGDSMTSNSQSKSTVTNGATRSSSRLGKSASVALGSSGDPGAIHKAYTGSLQAMYNMLEDPFPAPANMTSQYPGSGLSTGRAVHRSTQSGPMPNHMDAPPALGTAAPPASEIDDDSDSIISWETEEMDTINSDSLSDDEPLMIQVRRSKPNQAQAPPAPTVSTQESQACRQVGTNSGGQGFSSKETVNPSVSVNQVPSMEDTNRPRYFSQPNDLPHMVHRPMQSGPSYGQQSNLYPMISNHYHFPPTASTQVPHPLFQQIGANSSMGLINAPPPGIYNQPGPASFGSSHKSLASGFPGGFAIPTGLTSQGFPHNQNFPGRIPQLVQEPALQLTTPYDGTVRNFTLEFQRVSQTLAASGHIVSISLEEFQLLNDNLSTSNHYPLNRGDVPLALIKFNALKTMLISEMKLDINKEQLLYRPGRYASGFHEQPGVLDYPIHSDISLRHAIRACRNANRGALKVWVKAI